MKHLSESKLGLFLGTFLSSFLLVFGVGVLALTYFPLLLGTFWTLEEYNPQLPLAEARDAEVVEAPVIPIKELYPPLSNVENVEAGNWIRIPSIGVHVPLAQSPTLQDADIISTLNNGAALYPNGIKPGRLGNTFIAAHSTGNPWHGPYRFAFLKINEVQDGNFIHLDYEGTRYTYRVVRTDVIKPSPDYRVISDRPVPTMTLMACWPLWTTEQRMLKHAELVHVTKLTQRPS